MGLFSAIKTFFEPDIDEPWRQEFKQQEAARKTQSKVEELSNSSVTKEKYSANEEIIESITFNPMYDTYDIHRQTGL